MLSFQIGIRPNRRAAARFIFHVRRTLQRVLIEEQEKTGITQSEVARRIEVHRSVISRELNGRKDITLGRVAELAWALGREIVFDLPEPTVTHGDNYPANSGVIRSVIQTSTANPPATSYVKVTSTCLT